MRKYKKPEVRISFMEEEEDIVMLSNDEDYEDEEDMGELF